MEFYFQNNFLELNPYLRKTLKVIKEGIGILIFVFAVFSFFSEIPNLRFLSFLLFLFLSFQFFTRNRSKEDVRFLIHHQEKLNLNDYLDKKTKNFLIETITKGEIFKIEDFQLLLFNEFLKTKEIKNLFFRLNLANKKISLELKTTNEVNYQDTVLEILKSAFNLAKSLNLPSINLLILFGALRNTAHPELEKIFDELDLKKEYVLSGIVMEIFSKKFSYKKFLFQPLAVFQQKTTKKAFLNRALTSKATNILDNYALDLTYLANKENAGFLIGHREELEKLINNLKDGDNVLLVGEEGTGKEAVILHLAWLIQNDLVPKELLDYRLVKLDLSLLYSQNKENFLSILTKIIEDIIDSGYIILYFPYLENIILEKDIDVFQLLGEVLRSKTIPIIATMTPIGYERSLTKVNLNAFFEKIDIHELSEEESIYFLTLESLIFEKEEKVIISPQAISTAVYLAKKFIKEKTLPRSAEDLIVEAINLCKKTKGQIVTKEAIQEIVFEKTKIPVKELAVEEKEKLLNLENLLHQRIVNQDEAIKEIARVLRIYHAGLEKKKGPIGVFLFVGPTGVGKTETAKALAKIYYGSEQAMIRLDMVEFQNPEDIDKLIGTKDGQILGRLTEPVRQNPYSLILLDEFEKTHPTILKIFLPIFDEGLIKDALGREVDFNHSLIICTSNAYSEFIKESIEKGENFDKIKDELKDKLTQIFSVELLNRFDQIVVYKPLGEKELLKIAEILIKDLAVEVLLKHGIEISVSENALKEIVRLGTDPIYGARPLKRKIDEIIKNELANLILANKISRGNKISIDFDKEFKFII